MNGVLLEVVDPRFRPVVDLAIEQVERRAGLGVQVVLWHDGRCVVDLAVGCRGDDLFPVLSVSKGLAAFAFATLVGDGLISLEDPVALHWPEFATNGREAITVREALSHQAGVPAFLGDLSLSGLLDERRTAARLAAQPSLWRLGTGFAYHPVTIGTIANELSVRVSGQRLQERFLRRVRGQRDVHLGVPSAEMARVRSLTVAPTPPATHPATLEGLVAASLSDAFALQRFVSDPEHFALGHPAAGGVASARGIAALYATSGLGDGRGPDPAVLRDLATPAAIGNDLSSGEERSFGALFQTPTRTRPWAGFRAFGHEGAGGALGYWDPDARIALGYVPTVDPGESDVDAISRLAFELAAG